MLLLMTLLSCNLEAVDKQSFPARFAEAQCRVYKTCHRAYFDGEFELMETCEERVQADLIQSNEELFADCTFLPEKAQECLWLLDNFSCGDHWSKEDDIYQACHDDVWACD